MGLPERLQHLSFAIPGWRECRAEKCKWKHPHKRDCPHGHDTFDCGRDSSGACRICRSIRTREWESVPVNADRKRLNNRKSYARHINEYRRRNREAAQRKYWTDHEHRFDERRRARERRSPHIWTASKEVV